MSVITLPPGGSLQPPSLPVRRFSVDEYHQMVRVGILTDEDRVELLEELIVPKMPHNPAHDNSVELADEVIRPWVPAGWRIRIQSAITTGDSEPEPDLAVVRGRARTRRNRH